MEFECAPVQYLSPDNELSIPLLHGSAGVVWIDSALSEEEAIKLTRETGVRMINVGPSDAPMNSTLAQSRLRRDAVSSIHEAAELLVALNRCGRHEEARGIRTELLNHCEAGILRNPTGEIVEDLLESRRAGRALRELATHAGQVPMIPALERDEVEHSILFASSQELLADSARWREIAQSVVAADLAVCIALEARYCERLIVRLVDPDEHTRVARYLEQLGVV